MRPIPRRHKELITNDPRFGSCERTDDLGRCGGRLTVEHALYYGGQQISEMWAYVSLCWFHHLGAGLNKRLNQLIALRRAADKDLEKYPSSDWQQKRESLEREFEGVNIVPVAERPAYRPDPTWGRPANLPPRRREIDLNTQT